MIDLRGAIVGPPNEGGLCPLLQTGYETPRMLELLPGAFYSQRWRRWYIPDNALPVRERRPVRPASAPSGLKLRRYQSEALALIEYASKGCLLALDVGLGKTVITLQYLYENPSLRPFLIVGPLIAASIWVGSHADPFKHYGLRVEQLRTTAPGEKAEIGKTDGYFLNYAILPAWRPWIELQIVPKVIVLDEAHELRNVRNIATKDVRKLCNDKSIDKRIALTATPAVNGVHDLWSLLDCVQPSLWGAFVIYNEKFTTSFATRYSGAHQGEYGWIINNGETNADELRARLGRVLYRRSRLEVLAELPPFERQVIHLQPSTLDQTAYQAYTKTVWSTGKNINDLTGAAGLRRVSAMAAHLSKSKRAVASRVAKDLALATPNGKIVVFAWYQETAAAIVRYLTKNRVITFGPVTGKMNDTQRLACAQQFRDTKCDAGYVGVAFVATLGSAGLALNQLAAASAALFVDLYWVPMILLQAEGRLHRTGQEAAKVLFQYLVVDNTIDTIMFEHLERKAKAIAKSTGSREAISLCESLGGKNEQDDTRELLKELAAMGKTEMELQ